MKPKLIFLLIVVTLIGCVVTLIGCAENKVETTKNPGEPECRIKGKEYTTYKGHGYVILEVDGNEYLCSDYGGICPLVKNK